LAAPASSGAAQAPAAKPQAKRTPLELLQTAHTLFLQRDYEAAREYYLEVLPSFPKNFEILKNLATCFYRRGPRGYAQAASYYSKALEINPESIEVSENLARCLEGLNRHTEAAAIYERMAKQPGAAAVHWKSAADAYAEGDRNRQAEAAYDAYLQRSPGDLGARTRLGDLYAREKNYTRAQEQYRIVLTSNPNFPGALIGMGRVSSWQGQHEEALKYFDRVLRQNPNHGEAETAKAFALLWTERYDEALVLFQKLQKRYPRSSEIAHGLELSEAGIRQRELFAARAAGDTVKIESHYRQLLERNPKDTTALRVLADASATPERCQESIDLSRRGLEVAPHDMAFESRMARALVLCQRYEEAIAHYQRVIQADPKSPGPLTEMGSILLRAGRHAEALDAFRKALSYNPKSTDARLGLALALAANRNYEEALVQYDEVLKTSPDNYDALQGKAFVLSWTGRSAESRAIFQSLASKRPDDVQNKEALDRIAASEEEARWAALRPEVDSPPQEWITYYDKRLAAYPDDLTALKGRAYQLSLTDDTSAAIQAYRGVVARDPEDMGGKRVLARLLARDRQYDEAIRLYQEVMAASPTDYDSLESLARAQGWAGQDRASLQSFQKLLAVHPPSTLYQMEVARLQLRLQETTEARESLHKVIAAEPQNREAHIELARLDLRQGNQSGALSHYAAVLKQDPYDSAALLGKARISYYQGQLKQAHAAASDAVAGEPKSFDALFLLASIEHARGRRRQTNEFLNRADQVIPNNPEVAALRRRMREESAVTLRTTTSYAREIGPAGDATLGELPVSFLGIETDAQGAVVVDGSGVPVPQVIETAFPQVTVSGLPNEDVRYQTYGATIGIPLSPKLDSYFSFTSLPTQSPTPSIEGAVAPWTFVSRLSWRPSRYLTLRGGAGLARFGPAGIQRSPDLTGNMASLVDRFGPSVTDALGVTSATIPGLDFKPVGLAGATIAPSRKFSIDLDWNHGPAIYYPTPRAMRLHLTQTRFDGTLNFYFTPRTELHFNLFYTRLFTDSYVQTSDFNLLDPDDLAAAFTPYTAVILDSDGDFVEFQQADVPVRTPLFLPVIGRDVSPPPPSGPPFLFYPSSGVGSCPEVTLDSINNVTAQPTQIASTTWPLCALGEVTSQTTKATDWGHGGAITFIQNIVQSERFSLDGGYQGTAYGFAGQRINMRPKVFFGFFNPIFYQNHMLTGRVYGKLFGPVSYDLSGGLGLQQTDRIDELTLTSISGPLTRSSKVRPALSFKVSSNLTIGIAYTHYNTAQVLGPLRGNVVALTTDWKF
jgi:tetratricopeptide (TPR) repeat protein